MADATALEVAIGQIEFARKYTLELIEEIPADRWFEMLPGVPTHIAWQVAHLAMAEYGLCLFRQRGRQSIDTELMTSKFRKQFSRGSTPNPDVDSNPSVGEIREVLERVHRQCSIELQTFSLESFDEEIDMPYAVYNNKLGALLFCSKHEMIHAGQIGLIRRTLGLDPVR
ncbi:MAG: hypothetical protein ACI9G1_001625 [Pirellulaceae bacterium]|jgi:hypothetical protein